MSIDHVVFCVSDLERASQHLARGYGFVSHAGGRHPGHGTANRIVPLGESYLELVAVVDPIETAGSLFGSWVDANATNPPRPHALCLRTDDLDGVCERLGLEPVVMSRETPDGSPLRWRLAGFEQVLTESLPFFIEWQVPDDRLPGRMEPGNDAHIDEVIVTGDPDRLQSWVADATGVTIEAGSPGIDWVGFAVA
ncbi:MAG: VOC family protein [Acidimicrobiia bacterium]